MEIPRKERETNLFPAFSLQLRNSNGIGRFPFESEHQINCFRRIISVQLNRTGFARFLLGLMFRLEPSPSREKGERGPEKERERKREKERGRKRKNEKEREREERREREKRKAYAQSSTCASASPWVTLEQKSQGSRKSHKRRKRSNVKSSASSRRRSFRWSSLSSRLVAYHSLYT